MLGKAGNEAVRRDQKSFSFANGGKSQARKFDDAGKSNLFLAIVPERDVALQAAEIGRDVAQRHGALPKLRPHELMHVSLNAIGKYADFPDDVIFAVSAAMATVKAMPFEVTFDRVMHFASANAVVLGNPVRSEEMMDLHVQLAKEMWAVGLTFTYNPRFTPHMTLFYDQGPVPEHRLAEPITWVAREFVLIRSFIGKSEYEYIDRWPLLG
ncbi:2'-5' RNA ligase family protein [Pararhizobium sp. BT-229]|uniref:2'-5' RNA ligase family protein n=1 Tax=Pararhizobium sp. BT-229 TaxID=2986923 RepID=UPI0021F72340|nr:2'-5' RNA ligase family protein [Pararhizobium sp. BT-229]MCV9962386.1 2'-5' RNA ligase family protein [Pararhizobium sp. BT-229]